MNLTLVPPMHACAWCTRPFTPNALGRPRVYCSLSCRREHGRYADALPRWRRELAEAEASAAGYRGGPPTFLRNEIASLRALIAGRPIC